MQTAKLTSAKSPANVVKQTPLILTINGGSSSIKFAAFSTASPHQRIFGGQVERIGVPGTLLTATCDHSGEADRHSIAGNTFRDGVQSAVSYLRQRIGKSRRDPNHPNG